MVMVIYYFSLLNILEKVQNDVLGIIRDINDSREPNPFVYSTEINAIYDNVCKKFSLPPLSNANRASDLTRHLSFAKYYSEKGKDASLILSNLEDVIYMDLPQIRSYLLAYFDSSIDEELLARTRNLLCSNEITSAVRESFVILSGRLRRKFNIPTNVQDGVGLISSIFKEDRTIKYIEGDELTEKEKRFFCNMISGTYSLIRNDAAHEGDIKAEDANAALATINYVLKKLGI